MEATQVAELKTRIILRNDTTANWNQNSSVVLKKGEIGIEYLVDGSTRIKFGDGTTTWASLAYHDAKIEVDGTSIVLNGTKLAIKGAAEAEDGAQLVKTQSGLQWVKPSTETVEGLQTTVATLEQSVEELKQSVEGAEDRFSSIEGDISNIQGELAEVDSKIAEAVAAAEHLQRKIVGSVDEIKPSETGADKYIYLVSKEGAENDSYDEYMVIDGKVEKVGSWSVDLSDYATSESVEEDIAALKSEILGTEDASIKEEYSGDPTIYDIAKKLAELEEEALTEADITIATTEKAGIVLSSNTENSIVVDGLGKMTVHSLNVNKLVQTQGEEFILNCGTAAE